MVIWATTATHDPNSITSSSDGHNLNHLNLNDNNFLSFQERVPRSVIDNKIENEKIFQRDSNNKYNSNKNLSRISNNNNENLFKYSNYNNYVNKLKNKFPITALNDIFISVKTTKTFHKTRLDVILKTWFTLAKDQVNFF